MTKIEKNPNPTTLKIDEIIEPEKEVTVVRTIRQKNKPTLHLAIIGMMFLMLVCGFVILYSVSGPTGYRLRNDSAYFVKAQLTYTLFGLVIVFLMTKIKLEIFCKKIFMVIAYAVSLVLIIITSLVGAEHNGARRWLKVGSVEIMTSEILKFSLVFCYAVYRTMIEKMRQEGKLKATNPKRQWIKDLFFDFILPGGLMLLTDVFVAVQPHVSCAVIIGVVCFSLFFISGIRARSWLSFTVIFVIPIATLAALFIFNASFRDGVLNAIPDDFKSNYEHIFKRMAVFLGDEENVNKNTSMQVDIAGYTLGSGGFWGLGLGQSRSKYSYLPEAHNDYAYSIFIEETGMPGGIGLLIIYLTFITMGLAVVSRAKNTFYKIMAMGPTILIGFEALWNMAVQLQISPNTGVTLPFVSYGGMAQLCLLINVSFLVNVAKYGIKDKNEETVGESTV